MEEKTRMVYVKEEDSYRKARERHIATLNNVPDLGTNGSINWSRGDVHERHKTHLIEESS